MPLTMKTSRRTSLSALVVSIAAFVTLAPPVAADPAADTSDAAAAAAAAPRISPDGCTRIAASEALRCSAHSEAMDRDIPVLVRPSLTAGSREVATFLDGANNSGSNGWLSTIKVHRELADDDATLVFPVMDPWTWTQDFDDVDAVRYETFVAEELPDYLEGTFGVPDGGRGSTGVSGLSSGAYGAMNLASKYPGQYNAVWAMSGLYDPGMPAQKAVVDISARGRSEHHAVPWASGDSVKDNNPTLRLENLTMPVMVNAASGVPNLGNLGPDPLAVVFEGGPFEFGSMVFTRELELRTRLRGMDNVHYRYDLLGAHDWDTWIRAALDDDGAHRFMDAVLGEDGSGDGSAAGSAGGSSVSSGPGASS